MRPRVAISTAALTSSGRATMSSWAMNEPIDTATMRAGAAPRHSISAAVSATMVCVVKPSAFSVAPMPRLSKVMHAVSGRQECRDLMWVPGASERRRGRR